MKNRIKVLLIFMAAILLLSNTTIIGLEKRKSNLNEKLNEVISYVPEMEIKNTAVSEATVAWHMDHIFLFVNQIYKALEQSDERNFKTKFNIKRAYVFTFKKLPRGSIQAPESVSPDKNIAIETLQMHYNKTLNTLDKLSKLKENQHFNHPVLGTINRNKTIKFMTIHTEHHLKIIRDILKDK